MSRESALWLNSNTLIGMGHRAWHLDVALQASHGLESNHYAGSIPLDDVNRRLFAFDAVEANLWADFNGRTVPVADRKAIVHGTTGEVFGLFSDSYAVHQHRTLTTWAEQITDNTVGVSSAGLLSGGAVAWVSVSLADTTTTAEGVEFLPYLMLFGSHNGKHATSAKRVITNVVCDNTMGAALGEKTAQAYKIKHTRNSVLKINDARTALGLIVESADAFSAQVKALCETTVTDREWFAFLDVIAPIPVEAGRSQTMAVTKQDELKRLWTRDNRVAPWKGTAWGVVQAVNTFTHHYQTVRGALRPERNLLSTLSGDFDALDASTLDTLGKVLASA